jgi:hypothetical protein
MLLIRESHKTRNYLAVKQDVSKVVITRIQKIYMENIIKVKTDNGMSEDFKSYYPRGEARMPTVTCFI